MARQRPEDLCIATLQVFQQTQRRAFEEDLQRGFDVHVQFLRDRLPAICRFLSQLFASRHYQFGADAVARETLRRYLAPNAQHLPAVYDAEGIYAGWHRLVQTARAIAIEYHQHLCVRAEGLGTLFVRHREMIVRVLHRRLRYLLPDDENEVVNDFYLEFCYQSYADEFLALPEEEQVGRLLRKAKYFAIDVLRKSTRLKRHEKSLESCPSAVHEMMARRMEIQLAALSGCLESMRAVLTPEQQQLIYLRFFEGYTVAETAGKLNLSESSVHRAITEIYAAIRKAFPDRVSFAPGL